MQGSLLALGSCLASLLAAGAAPQAPAPPATGEGRAVPVTVREIPRPGGPQPEGPLPRPLFLARIEERGKTFDEPMVSSWWLFDPVSPGQGLRLVFRGPGNDQYFRFLTPLFNGWGVACGSLDRKREPPGGSSMFWFRLPEGKLGPRIDETPLRERLDASGLVYQRVDTAGPVTLGRVARFDPLRGTLRVTELPLAGIRWLDRTELLGIADPVGTARIVRLDTVKSETSVVGAPPPGYDPRDWRDEATGIYPAGPGCRDGIYAICDFSLWFMPRGEGWRPVLRKVPIVKTFGGRMPHLPVAYLGRGRFAVAKTVKEHAEPPASVPAEDRIFGAAESVTMLVDGHSGKVLAETPPVLYNHNPDLQIPDEWWSPDAKPVPPQATPRATPLFRWAGETREIRFAGDRSLRLGDEEECHLSHDGRYLAIHPGMAEAVDGKTSVVVRVIDGRTGEIHAAGVSSTFAEAMIDGSWQVLCSGRPEPALLENFESTGFDWFREPAGNFLGPR